MAIFKAGVTFSKAHNFGYPAVSFWLCNPFCVFWYPTEIIMPTPGSGDGSTFRQIPTGPTFRTRISCANGRSTDVTNEFYRVPFKIHSLKLTWNPKMEVWKIIFHFKQVIFRFHVSFCGCMCNWYHHLCHHDFYLLPVKGWNEDTSVKDSQDHN